MWRIGLALPAQHLNIRGAAETKVGEVRSDGVQELSRQNSLQVSLEETVGTEAVLVSRLPLDKLSNLTIIKPFSPLSPASLSKPHLGSGKLLRLPLLLIIIGVC